MVIFRAITVFMLCCSISAQVWAQEIRWESTGYDWVDTEVDTFVAEGSSFILSDDGSELMHFTTKLVSIYFVQGWQYDRKRNTLSSEIISDAGHRYYCEIDENRAFILFKPVGGNYGFVSLKFSLKL